MNLLLTALVAAGLALGVIAAKGKSPETGSETARPVLQTAVQGADERFVLRSADNLSCEIARGEATSSGVYALRADPECEGLLPGLSDVRFWQEGSDGSVVLGRNLADQLISFAVADGIAYESFRPTSALISLVAQD